jgi:uncharacterized protein
MKQLSFFLLFTVGVCTAFGQSYVQQWNDARVAVKPGADVHAYAFPLGAVTLLESPFKAAMQRHEGYLLFLNPDRFLADFRGHAGLKPKAAKYGGWESSGLAGHSLGHYLTALSLHYASTGNAECLKRVNYIIDELDECQKARKSGYLGAIPNEDSVWADVAKGNIRSRGFDLNGAWSPWYTVHKIMAGLTDAYLFAGNKKALSVVKGMAAWTHNTLKNLDDSLLQKMLLCEYGGMNDVLVNLYEITGDKSYLSLSYKFYDNQVLDSLAKGKDDLAGKHSNTQIPKAIGSARRYQLVKDARDSAIAHFFWTAITRDHSYANGGNSNYEYLAEPKRLNDQLTDNTTETCNTYNMLKLTRQLFMLHPSAAYMDYYEKALYNHILTSQNHRTAMTTYFVSLRMGGRKEYSDSLNTFTCCVGTGMENHMKYNESIYFRGKDGSLYVNLFISSVLHWKEKGLHVKQETALPAEETVRYTFAAAKPVSATIRIRKPHWTQNAELKINGVVQNLAVDENGYLVIKRFWKNGDKMELLLLQQLYTEAMPDNAARKAVFYGPVLLAGILGTKEPEPSEIPVFVTAEKDANNWLMKDDKGKLIFKTRNLGVPTDVSLIPFNQTADEYYSVYWDVFTPQEWAVHQKAYEEEKRKAAELEARTVDILRIGEMQPERDHNLSGDKTETGIDHNRKWRTANSGGSFSFTMKVSQDSTNTLICTYWGMDNRGRTFDMLVDDAVVATEDLNKYKTNKFYDIAYVIPPQLTKGKQSVTVKFVPKPNNSAGPVYGVRMAKGDVTNLLPPTKNESIYR